MKLWKKRKFYNHHWFWCQLHGITFFHLDRINGDFIRFTKHCEVKDGAAHL